MSVPGSEATKNQRVRDPEGGAAPLSLTDLLLSETAVTEEQIQRAARIAERMRKPVSVCEILVQLGQLSRTEQERLLRLHRSRMDIAQILHEDGHLDQEALDAYRSRMTAEDGFDPRNTLVGEGLVPEETYLRALCAKHDIPYMEPETALVEEQLISRVSFPYLLRHHVLPFRMVGDTLTVILRDPLDRERIQELEKIFDTRIRPCGATGESIEKALKRIRTRLQGGVSADEEVSSVNYREIREITDSEDIGVEAIRIVDHILYRGIAMGASDVHVEPRAKEVAVRVRVDGVLQPLTELPADFAPRIAARIKVLCGVDLAEKRRHQDGRIYAKVDGREVDMRVSTYASVFGETIVIRLLDRRHGLIPLEGLGLEAGILRILQEVILRASSGLTLVTGPTGSGKTTTLYSFIDSILDGRLKVITCEDPVEYVLDGVTQCSVNQKTGPTFADSLRAIVRQDPDVIVVGEIRDRATAELAVEAALTGHKVLSSFHTEDSVSAVVRLLELGVEPFLVSSTLGAVVAQRLVRRICSSCAKPTSAAKRDLRYLSLSRESLDGVALIEGGGCEQCGGTGFRGRLGIHEVMLPDDDFRDAILRRAPSKELREMAKRLPGFLTLQENGLLKIAQGATTLSELANQIPRDVQMRPMKTLRQIAAVRTLR